MKSSTLQRDCLVAVVTSDADLARFVDGGLYRIPDRSIGRLLSHASLAQTKRVALYQTGSITDGLPSVVELHGAVERVTIEQRRRIIPEEADHPSADESYHVVRVASVQRLEVPLMSHRPRRITFVRSTTERLLHARDINDLFIGTRAEEALWPSLRELGAERRCFMNVSDHVMEVDFAIVNNDRAIGIVCSDDDYVPDAPAGDWSVMRFSNASIEGDLPGCLQQILDVIRGERASRTHVVT